MARLFFALWPDDRARAALDRLAASVATSQGGRRVRAAGLHLTLVFLGECDDDQAVAASRVASGLHAPAFGIRLDRIGAFPKAGVAWAGCETPAPSLQFLQAALADRLRGAGFVLEDRPFAVHLTLARRIREAPAERTIEPVAWRAGSFALVRSQGGAGGYETVAEWPLQED